MQLYIKSCFKNAIKLQINVMAFKQPGFLMKVGKEQQFKILYA